MAHVCFHCLQRRKGSVKLIPLMWFPGGEKTHSSNSAHGVMDLPSLQPGSIGTSVSLLVDHSCWNQLINWTPSWQVSHEHL